MRYSHAFKPTPNSTVLVVTDSPEKPDVRFVSNAPVPYIGVRAKTEPEEVQDD